MKTPPAQHSTPVTPSFGLLAFDCLKITASASASTVLAARLAYNKRTSMMVRASYLLHSRDRNSRRRVGSFRKAPRITLLVIIDSSSLTPRQCMQ